MKGLFRRYKRSKLNREQIRQMAGFAMNLSLVFFGSVITPMFSGVDKVSVFAILWGVFLGLLGLLTSLVLTRRIV